MAEPLACDYRLIKAIIAGTADLALRVVKPQPKQVGPNHVWFPPFETELQQEELWTQEEWGAWMPGKGWLCAPLWQIKDQRGWNVVYRADVVRETPRGVHVSVLHGCGGEDGILFEGRPCWRPPHTQPRNRARFPWLTVIECEAVQLGTLTEQDARRLGFDALEQLRLDWDNTHRHPVHKAALDPWVWRIRFRNDDAGGQGVLVE